MINFDRLNAGGLKDATTLKHWRERLEDNRGAVIALKDERFYRKWQFYLAASEAAFAAGDMMVFQIQLSKTRTALPLTRAPMLAAEQNLAARHNASSGSTLVGNG